MPLILPLFVSFVAKTKFLLYVLKFQQLFLDFGNSQPLRVVGIVILQM